MIISASRRTDIPSYYGQWFINRLHEGHVFIPNPYNVNRYSKAYLNKEAVDIIAFWTKNPSPFLKFLPQIDALGYKYFFQFTLTPYGKETEKNLPNKNTLIETFINLSQIIGKQRIIWRYDPVIVNERYTLNYHAEKFAYMAKILAKSTDRCIISFVDSYKNVGSRLGNKLDYMMSTENMYAIAEIFSKIAKENALELLTCSEQIALEQFGIEHAACIDKKIIEAILNCKINVQKDKNQRADCLCVESIDIGTYNCCANGCNYCYALTSEVAAKKHMLRHNPASDVLIGEMLPDVIITERKSISVLEKQLQLPF